MARSRYDAVAVVLHWAIAAAILANLAVGWWMGGALKDPALESRAIAAFQLHKSLGLTVLVLSLLRLAWRLAHRPPPLPAGMKAWEILSARASHWAFYALMIVLPLSGWLYVSAQWRHDAPLEVPTLWFGLFEVPHLFGLDQAEPAFRQQFSGVAGGAHKLLAKGMAGLLGLHVAAALKHQFLDRNGLLARMQPGLGATLALAVLVLAAVAGIFRVSEVQVAKTVVGEVAGGWSVDPASSIRFSGHHAGIDFHGRFTRWSADIRFDPAHPHASVIRATVETGSATDGVPLHDETLPQAEWFDVARYPTAQFRATRIAPLGGDRYAVEGVLTIKDRQLPISGLTARIGLNRLWISGRFRISRADANLGQESDPDGEYVSPEIDVEVDVVAARPE